MYSRVSFAIKTELIPSFCNEQVEKETEEAIQNHKWVNGLILAFVASIDNYFTHITFRLRNH